MLSLELSLCMATEKGNTASESTTNIEVAAETFVPQEDIVFTERLPLLAEHGQFTAFFVANLVAEQSSCLHGETGTNMSNWKAASGLQHG